MSSTVVLLILLAILGYFAVAIYVSYVTVPHTLPYQITTNWAAPPREGAW